MTRSRFDQTACDHLAHCVQEIENSTAVELVIVVRARAGQYRHADYLFGALLAFLGLLFLLFSPVTFHQMWVAIDVGLLFVIGAYLSSRSNLLRRLFTTEKQRAANVRLSAAAMFYEAGIANTESETGVLIYLSLFERRLELIADRAVMKAVPSLAWNTAVFELHRNGSEPEPQLFLDAVRKFGKLLAEHLPAGEVNIDELPNRPHFDLK
jgi:putative membrane protein